MLRRFAVLPALVGLAAIAVLPPREAAACGGCFVPTTERTVVTDHRMALSVSRDQTVLWDQIRYSGDPAEFAWVLPVRAGAKLELANDELFTALDASTQPVVVAPNRFGGAYGCGLTGCASSEAASSSSPGAGQVQVLSQSVVGPYETVTLRATDSDALSTWLRSHAFAIPETIAPTIRAYVEEGFDFLALRLRPGCGERAMQPVRVVTKGADPTLPLRMVAAGIGPRVGITLWVISEGRYQPQNFPVAEIDEEKILWDRTQNRSNYEALSQSVMGQANGRTWLVEYADLPQTTSPFDPFLNPYGASPYATQATARANGYTPGLADTYYGLCKFRPRVTSPTASPSGSSAPYTPCPRTTPAQDPQQQDPQQQDPQQQDPQQEDAGTTDDGGTADAGAREPGAPAAEDAGAPEAPTETTCRYLDDLAVATKGMALTQVWVTRLRAVLPADALSAGDLRLEPTRPQTPVANVHVAAHYADEVKAAEDDGGGSCVSAPRSHSTFGAWALGSLAGLALVARLRRRRMR